MDGVFHALSHAARREMLSRLTVGELTVGELAEPLTMSLAAASKHIKVLEGAGLVSRTVSGRRHVCRFEPGALSSASAWLTYHEQYWKKRIDALDTLLQAKPVAKSRKRR